MWIYTHLKSYLNVLGSWKISLEVQRSCIVAYFLLRYLNLELMSMTESETIDLGLTELRTKMVSSVQFIRSVMSDSL